MTKISIILAAILLSGCAGPFSFTGENANKGYVVFSVGVSEACDEQSKFHAVLGFLTGMEGQQGRPFNLRNPFLSYDFDELGSVVYSYPLDPGKYAFSRLSIMDAFSTIKTGTTQFKADQQLVPYEVSVEAGKINYLGSIIFHGQEATCEEDRYRIEVLDRKKRDMALVAKKEPLLFPAGK